MMEEWKEPELEKVREPFALGKENVLLAADEIVSHLKPVELGHDQIDNVLNMLSEM